MTPDAPLSADASAIVDRGLDLASAIMELIRIWNKSDNLDGRVVMVGFGVAAGCYLHGMPPALRAECVRHLTEQLIKTSGVHLRVEGMQ